MLCLVYEAASSPAVSAEHHTRCHPRSLVACGTATNKKTPPSVSMMAATSSRWKNRSRLECVGLETPREHNRGAYGNLQPACVPYRAVHCTLPSAPLPSAFQKLTAADYVELAYQTWHLVHGAYLVRDTTTTAAALVRVKSYCSVVSTINQ